MSDRGLPSPETTENGAVVQGPLAGVRVLELANFISGPYAAMLLGDLGARVIKVELPGAGDPFRKWGGHRGSARPQFAAYNRGKQSVSVNLKKPQGVEVVHRLAERVDVIIENFRPGTLDRLGVGYEDMRKRNPRLIYCAISGTGQSGPYSKRPAYDSIGLALSGLWSRFVDRTEPKVIGPNVADQLTSLYAVYGILGALTHQIRHGVGQRVDVNLLLSTMAFIPEPIANYCQLGEVGDIDTRARRSQAYAVIARDGLPLTVHLSSVPKFWEGLTRVLERPELLDDPRFLTNKDRVDNYADLQRLLDELFKERSRDEWLSRLNSEDVPAAPINSVAEALDDEQVRHLGALQQYGKDDRAVDLVRCPVDYSVTAVGTGSPPPLPGEHTNEVLGECGFTPEEIDALRAENVV